MRSITTKANDFNAIKVWTLRDILSNCLSEEESSLPVCMPYYNDPDDRDENGAVKDFLDFGSIAEVKSVGILKHIHSNGLKDIALYFASCDGYCSIKEMMNKSGLEFTGFCSELLAGDKPLTAQEIRNVLDGIAGEIPVGMAYGGELGDGTIDAFCYFTSAGIFDDCGDSCVMFAPTYRLYDIKQLTDANPKFPFTCKEVLCH